MVVFSHIWFVFLIIFTLASVVLAVFMIVRGIKTSGAIQKEIMKSFKEPYVVCKYCGAANQKGSLKCCNCGAVIDHRGKNKE